MQFWCQQRPIGSSMFAGRCRDLNKLPFHCFAAKLTSWKIHSQWCSDSAEQTSSHQARANRLQNEQTSLVPYQAIKNLARQTTRKKLRDAIRLRFLFFLQLKCFSPSNDDDESLDDYHMAAFCLFTATTFMETTFKSTLTSRTCYVCPSVLH